MSTYAVFGMTKPRAIAMARRELEPWHKEEKRPLTPEEYEAVVEQRAQAIMASQQCVQLSDKFDAPQFAREYLELAKKIESRSLHVKAWHKTGEVNPKTGKPVMTWAAVQ